MEILIWSGAALAMAGVFSLLWCIMFVLGIKRANLPDAEAQQAMQRVVVINMAALAISFVGLTAVMIGVILS